MGTMKGRGKSMVVRTLLAAAVTATLGFDPAAADQQERACRTVEMRLMQLQASGKGDTDEARSVRGMLAARGCAGGGRVARAEPQGRSAARAGVKPARIRRPALAETPSRSRRNGARILARAMPEADRSTRRARPGVSSDGRTFRTWCVRACDGYYFPISYSTTRKHFEADQATCQAMCPAAETGLYYHDARNGGPEDMISLAGRAYSELPSAFSYRIALDRSCTCVRAGDEPPPRLAPNVEETAPRIALLPKPRPAPDEDPETLANRAGRLDPAKTARTAIASADPVTGQSVRVVWPNWQTEQSQVVISAVPNLDF